MVATAAQSRTRTPGTSSTGQETTKAGVGVQAWIEKGFEVQRVSDRIILVKLIVGQSVVTFLSVYAPQIGLNDEVKDLFFDQLRAVIARILASEFLIPCGDCNGHVGKCMVGWGMAGRNQILRLRES